MVPQQTETPGDGFTAPAKAPWSVIPGRHRAETGPSVNVPPHAADQGILVAFIHRSRIDFRHARGLMCKRRRSIRSHDDEVLPAGFFAEALGNPGAAETAAEAALAAVDQTILYAIPWPAGTGKALQKHAA